MKPKQTPAGGIDIDKIQNLLVIVAMEVEEDAVLRALGGGAAETVVDDRLGISLKRVRKNGRSVLVTKSGVGAVNGALTTARIAQDHPVDAILLLGVAGSLRSDLALGDLVVAEDVVQHDAVFSGDDGTELMAPGELHVSVEPDKRPDPRLKADANLTAWIAALAAASGRRHVTGTLMSGSEFVGTTKRKLEIARLATAAAAVEMEAAGIALAAKKLGLPFAAAKTIADTLNPDGSISSDYKAFVKEAAKNASELISSILARWEYVRGPLEQLKRGRGS